MRTREEQIKALRDLIDMQNECPDETDSIHQAREHIEEAERRGYEKREKDYNECVKILGGPAESLGPQPPELPEQQDTAQQIEDVCNLLIELGQDSGCYATAERIVLEAERRAEARVRAEIARDSERLDWLLSRTYYGIPGFDPSVRGRNHHERKADLIRAIDSAREVG